VKAFVVKNKWPLIIALAAIVVRLVYLFELSSQPGFEVPMVDEKWHWLWAQEIIEKSFWGEGSYFRGPLYPYFLALLYFITDASIFWAKFLQVLLCGGTAIFTYKIAQRLFNQSVAVISGLAYACYGTLLFYETMFLIPVLFLFFLVWAIYRVIAYQDSYSIRSWIITGIVFGLAAISRPNVIVVVPFLAFWLYFKQCKLSGSYRKALVPAATLVAGMFLAIAPVTIRNFAVTGDFILVSSQGGINLYLGNNEVADGLTMVLPEVELSQDVTWDMFIPVTIAAAEKEAGRSLTDAEASSFWSGKALDFIISNPSKFLELVWKKSVYLLSGYENSDANDIYYQRGKSFSYSLLVWDKFISFPFGLLLPLFIVSLIVLRKDFKKLLPLYIFMLAYLPTIVLFLVTARHRLPLVPFMIVIAAGGTYTLIKRIKVLAPLKLFLILSVFVSSVLIFNTKYYELGIPNPFQIHFNDGLTYYRIGQFEKAEKEYLLADQTFRFSSALAVNLAEVQMKLGKKDDADRNLARALALNPQLAMAYNNLGVLVQSKGNLDSAQQLFGKAISFYNKAFSRPNEIGEYYVNLASILEKRNKIDSASWAFRQSMDHAPEYARAFYQAGAFFARNGRYVQADASFNNGLKIQSPKAADLYNWGLSYVEREMFSEGLDRMHRAISIDGNFHPAYYVIAAVHNKAGRPKDSVLFYLNICLSIAPDFGPAVQLKIKIEK